ncbi:hypothetical protein Tco_0490410 [Tanacetum coccineum]
MHPNRGEIADIDNDADTTLVDEGEGRKDDLMFDVEDLVGEESTPRAKGVTIIEQGDTHRTVIPKQISKDKGKAKMVEPEKPLKVKDQIRFDEQEARRLQALFDKEAMIANEEAQRTEEWNNIQAKIDADYELAQRLQQQEQEELTDADKAKLFVQLMEARKKYFAAKRAKEKRSKPPTKAQKRKTMSTYLKNMAGWKLHLLKNKSYDEVQELFDQAMIRVNTFVDMDSEVLEGSSKRAGDELKQESAKKQKTDNDNEIAKLKMLVEITPDKEEVAVDAIPLATKPLNYSPPEEERSSLKAKVLKARRGPSSSIIPKKATPSTSLVSDRLATSDTETVNRSSVKIMEVEIFGLIVLRTIISFGKKMTEEQTLRENMVWSYYKEELVRREEQEKVAELRRFEEAIKRERLEEMQQREKKEEEIEYDV